MSIRPVVYYAEVKIPFPEAGLKRLSDKQRNNLFEIAKAQDKYCTEQLASQLTSGNQLKFTTKALSQSEWDKRSTLGTDALTDRDIALMRKTMTIPFHLEKTDTGFTAVAFRAIGGEVVQLDRPLKLDAALKAAPEPQMAELNKIKEEIEQLRNKLKMGVEQPKGHDLAASAAAPPRPK
jgi:hypothetical protein